MIIPSFKLIQNDDFLCINIKAPYAKISEVDVFVEETDFRFYCKPYYLRLNLPGIIVDNENGPTYDFDEKMFKFKYEKANKGEHFEGLDLITKLLTPKNNDITSANRHKGPLIEELDSNENKTELEDEDEEEMSWFIEQNLNNQYLDDNCELNLNSSDVCYGFAQTKSKIFSKLSSEYSLVIELPDPDATSIEKRKILRIENENSKFDDEHYLADLFENRDTISELLSYDPEFSNHETLDYTDNELNTLKSLPKKTYLLDREQKLSAFCGLVDILFAYCYNKRTNLGEENSESGWTIAKLSSTLSWFDVFKSLDECVTASYRRSLCFPLYRNWKLSRKCYGDAVRLLEAGRHRILKCLLEIRSIFIDEDCRYILNDLYINDYCVWLQYVSEKKLKNLVECLKNIKITKEALDLDLDTLEIAGHLALEEELGNKSLSSSSGAEESESDTDEENNSSNQHLLSKIEEENNRAVESATIDLQTLRINDNTTDSIKSDKSKPKIVMLD